MLLLKPVTRYCLFGLLVVACLRTSYASEKSPPAFYSEEAAHWADSVMAGMNRYEVIGQLFMVAAWSNKDSLHTKEIRKLIENYGIGGLIFFQGGPVRQALLTNDYQKISKVPLLIGIDGEWGLAMRLDSTLRFPRQMTMSAMDDDNAVYRMGAEVARNCNRLGIHINFAPDADINTNPANPIIGSRSFGDDRKTVSKHSISYMRALQDFRVLSTGKHFPGHGNADTDSHFALPLIRESREHLDSVELVPFRRMIHEGMTGMMVAHLNIPSLDDTPDLPSTLSKKIVTGLLKEEMGFDGLIFTDALNMQGVRACYQPGVLDKLALLAGNDVLLYSEDVRKAVMEIHLAIENCEITEAEVYSRAKKILMAKYWCGLGNYQPVDTTNLIADLNSPKGKLLQRQLYENSVTVLKNNDSLLPLRTEKDSLRIACVSIGEKWNNEFQRQLSMYGHLDLFAEDKNAPVSVFDALFEYLTNYDYVILSLHNTSMRADAGYGVTPVSSRFIDKVLKSYKTIMVDFGNAYTLTQFTNLEKAEALVLAYEDFSMTHNIVAQMIMGGFSASGKMPVQSVEEFPKSTSIETGAPIRLKYTLPEEEGLSSVRLSRIDSICNAAITAGAMPGCQVLIARNGKVVYHKAFGYHTYARKDTVKITDVYDVASITKVAATALATMKLFEKKKIDLNKPLAKYLPALKNTNKRGLVVREILAHQSGLASWFPFYKQTLTDSFPSPDIYSKTPSDTYAIRVADSLYMRKEFTDSLIAWINNSPVKENGKYVYSDLGPVLIKAAVDRITDAPFEEYLAEEFYRPLGLTRTAFLPRSKFPLKQIVPTENDQYFRHQLVYGDVHDPLAAMFGGVSGNAGLFSNANDLAVIMQMLLNKGEYGGRRFLKEHTVELFTSQQFVQQHNRRGLLFDRQEPDTTKPGPCAKSASPMTFGHQGFTGTCAWADPVNGLIYIFLSNRVYPDAANDKFSKMNIRTTVHQAIYDAMVEE